MQYVREATTDVKYLISLYVTFTTLTTVGYGDITMRTTPELLFGIVMMALGASTCAQTLNSIPSILHPKPQISHPTPQPPSPEITMRITS